MAEEIRVGVVGCGYWGPNLVRNLRMLDGCRLEVICDTDQERLTHMKKLYPELRTETDVANVVSDDVDAIVIATPVFLHHELAKKSL